MTWSFLLTTLIVVASPGTGVLYTLAVALTQGGRASIAAAFGCTLAWIRARTDSVIPGMFLHGLFNLVALVAAVTIHG